MKRYTIVRVDNSCPAMIDDFGCIVARNMLHCKCGEDVKNYGDTKEQLIKKVAQVLYRDELRFCIWKEDIKYLPKQYERCLEKAKEIVEFLGVEE